MPTDGKVEQFEAVPTYIRAVQVTRENYKTIASRLGCPRIESHEYYDDQTYDYVVEYKFLDKDGAVKYTMQAGDYLLYTNTDAEGTNLRNRQVEVIPPDKFEDRYQKPSIHLTPQEYEDFQQMRELYLYPERAKKN